MAISYNDPMINQIINDPLYDIRTDGTIWSCRPPKGPGNPNKIYPWKRVDIKQHRGYVVNYNGFRLLAHRIVYRKFKGSLDQLYEINHMDGNPNNNKPDNLELVTPKENMEHASANNLTAKGERSGNVKLTEVDVRQIRHLLKTTQRTQKSIAKQFGIDEKTLYRIKTKRIWKHI